LTPPTPKSDKYRFGIYLFSNLSLFPIPMQQYSPSKLNRFYDLISTKWKKPREMQIGDVKKYISKFSTNVAISNYPLSTQTAGHSLTPSTIRHATPFVVKDRQTYTTTPSSISKLDSRHHQITTRSYNVRKFSLNTKTKLEIPGPIKHPHDILAHPIPILPLLENNQSHQLLKLPHASLMQHIPPSPHAPPLHVPPPPHKLHPSHSMLNFYRLSKHFVNYFKFKTNVSKPSHIHFDHYPIKARIPARKTSQISTRAVIASC